MGRRVSEKGDTSSVFKETQCEIDYQHDVSCLTKLCRRGWQGRRLSMLKKIVVVPSEDPLKGHFTLITLHRSHGKAFTSWRTIFSFAMRHSFVMGIDVIPSLYISSPWTSEIKNAGCRQQQQWVSFSKARTSPFLLDDIIFIVWVNKKKSDNQGWRDALETVVNEV